MDKESNFQPVFERPMSYFEARTFLEISIDEMFGKTAELVTAKRACQAVADRNQQMQGDLLNGSFVERREAKMELQRSEADVNMAHSELYNLRAKRAEARRTLSELPMKFGSIALVQYPQ